MHNSKIYDNITSSGYFAVMPGQEIGNKRMLEHIPTTFIIMGLRKMRIMKIASPPTPTEHLPFTYSVSFHKS